MEEVSQQKQLEISARKLAIEQPIVIPSYEDILDKIRLSNPSAREQKVSLSRVHTYVHTHNLGKAIGSQRIVFPSFASHWAVLVTENEYERKYARASHLTFKDSAVAMLTPPLDTSGEVVFIMFPMDVV